MNSIPSIRAALLLGTAALCIPAHADITSSFDSSLDGWTGLGGSVAHVVSGGMPSGHLQQQDTDETWMSVSAPGAYLGNLSAYLGGTVSFDALNVNGLPANLPSLPQFGTVTITGSGGSASRVLVGAGSGQPAPGAGWTHYVATLDAAAWSGDLAGALAGVTSLTVSLESRDGLDEIIGFDNFRLATAVPEPSALWLLAVGLGGVAVATRRRS